MRKKRDCTSAISVEKQRESFKGGETDARFSLGIDTP